MERFNRLSDYCYTIIKNLTSKENKGYAVGGMVCGGFYGAGLLSTFKDFWAVFSIAVILKGVMGLVYVGLSGMVTKMGAELWSDKIKPKIKFLNNGKDRSNTQKRA
jgi:hypothetical protein